MEQKDFLLKLQLALKELKQATTQVTGIDHSNVREVSDEVDRRVEKLLAQERAAAEEMSKSDMWPELGKADIEARR